MSEEKHVDKLLVVFLPSPTSRPHKNKNRTNSSFSSCLSFSRIRFVSAKSFLACTGRSSRIPRFSHECQGTIDPRRVLAASHWLRV